METRSAATLASILALGLAGCTAAAVHDSPAVDLAELLGEPDVPAWVEALEPGQEPRDGPHTSQVEELLLLASLSNGSEREARLGEALHEAHLAIRADSTNPLPWLQAGRVELELGRPLEAEGLLERAVELHPPYLPLALELRERAWVEAYRSERYEEALEGLETVALLLGGAWRERVDPEIGSRWDAARSSALAARGEILLKLERYADAAEAYGEVFAMNPDDVSALSLRAAAIVAAGEASGAEGVFADLLARPGIDASDYYTAGLGLFDAGDVEAAAAAFREAHRLVPQHREVLLALSQALYASGRWDELLDVSDRLLEIDPLNQDAYRLRMQGLSGADRMREAERVLEEMRRLPYSVDALAFRPAGRGAVLVGAMTNRSRPEGSLVRFRIHFYDARGVPVGSGDQVIELGDTGEVVSFEVAAPPVAGLFGYRYQVVGG